MSLTEYYRAFQESLVATNGSTTIDLLRDLPRDIAACVAAGHAMGLSVEELRRFLTHRAEINNVTAGLVYTCTAPEVLERIVDARRTGCVHAKDIMAHAFSPDEIHERFHATVYGKGISAELH